MKHWLLRASILASPVLQRGGVVLLFALNIIHPLIHGTPLDSGALDALLANCDAAAASLILSDQGVTK